jgi:hypothetical protein
MKIRELIKYSILPICVIYIYLMSWWFDSFKTLSIEEFIGPVLIIGLGFVIVIVFLFLFLFAFFRDKNIPILWVSLSVILNSFLTLVIENSKSTFLTLVYDYSQSVTTFLLFILAIGYFVFTVRYTFKIKGNRFLLLTLILSGLIFTYDFVYFGLLLVDAKFGKGIFMSLGVVLFLLYSFLIIFSMPNTDYMDWKKDHKYLFLRSILIPWVLILFLAFVNFVLVPVTEKSQLRKSKVYSFGMVKYEVKHKDGL